MEKPLILAFDTSGPYCAAALLSGDTVITQTVEEMKKGQAERLMFLLKELLQLHGLAYADLDALAVGTGPGNFTGIRIGVSAARGLALGLGIPAYGVNGFEQRAILNPSAMFHSIAAPRDQRYVRDASGAATTSIDCFSLKYLDNSLMCSASTTFGTMPACTATRSAAFSRSENKSLLSNSNNAFIFSALTLFFCA